MRFAKQKIKYLIITTKKIEMLLETKLVSHQSNNNGRDQTAVAIASFHLMEVQVDC